MIHALVLYLAIQAAAQKRTPARRSRRGSVESRNWKRVIALESHRYRRIHILVTAPGRGCRRPSLLDRPIGPAGAILLKIDIDRILFAATLDHPLFLPLSGAGRA